jgi:hypothetical protein
MWKKVFVTQLVINKVTHIDILILLTKKQKLVPKIMCSWKHKSNWETLKERRKIARLCALFKAHTGERASKAVGDRLNHVI